jgi:hypothetical protein
MEVITMNKMFLMLLVLVFVFSQIYSFPPALYALKGQDNPPEPPPGPPPSGFTVKGKIAYDDKNNAPVMNSPVSIKWGDMVFKGSTDEDGNFSIKIDASKQKKVSNFVEITCRSETIRVNPNVNPKMSKVQYLNGRAKTFTPSKTSIPWKLKISSK